MITDRQSRISKEPTPHQQRVEACVALAGPMMNAERHRQYLTGLNDRQLDERINRLRQDLQLRLATPPGPGRRPARELAPAWGGMGLMRRIGPISECSSAVENGTSARG